MSGNDLISLLGLKGKTPFLMRHLLPIHELCLPSL